MIFTSFTIYTNGYNHSMRLNVYAKVLIIWNFLSFLIQSNQSNAIESKNDETFEVAEKKTEKKLGDKKRYSNLMLRLSTTK